MDIVILVLLSFCFFSGGLFPQVLLHCISEVWLSYVGRLLSEVVEK